MISGGFLGGSSGGRGGLRQVKGAGAGAVGFGLAVPMWALMAGSEVPYWGWWAIALIRSLSVKPDRWVLKCPDASVMTVAIGVSSGPASLSLVLIR